MKSKHCAVTQNNNMNLADQLFYSALAHFQMQIKMWNEADTAALNRIVSERAALVAVADSAYALEAMLDALDAILPSGIPSRISGDFKKSLAKLAVVQENSRAVFASSETISICAWCDAEKTVTRFLAEKGYGLTHGMCKKHQLSFLKQ